MFNRKKVLIVILCLLCLGALYWASTYYVAYTDDAYVTSDVIKVAPELSGRIAEVHFRDNQTVHKGDPLVSLDPTPFQLDLATRKAELAKAEASLATFEEAVPVAQGRLAVAQAKLKLAREVVEQNRGPTREGAVSRVQFERFLGELGVAKGGVTSAKATLALAKREVAEQRAAIRICQAQVNLSNYNLERTCIYAPTDGYIASLQIRSGDYAIKGKPLIALVAADSWRVEANYREQFLRHILPGQEVWLYLDGHPWRLFKGRVQSIRRGVSRSPVAGELLPYVEPTTNWIRLSRRFPVRITLDDPPDDLRLNMGADARTLVIY